MSTNLDPPGLFPNPAEPLVPLLEALGGIIRPGGRRLHFNTAYRWVRKGVKLPDGQRLRLHAVKVAGGVYTTRAAVEAFIAAQNPVSDVGRAAVPRTPAARDRAANRALAELERMGI